MRNWIPALLMGVLMSGCVASQVVPKESAVRSMRIISVVPVESPPLLLQPNTEEDRKAIIAMMKSAADLTAAGAPGLSGPGASLAQSAVPLMLAPPEGLRSGASVVAAIGGMLMLLEAASSGKEVPGEVGAVVKGYPSQTWVPSVEYAKTAVLVLQKKGSLDVQMIDGYARLPIADRSITWHLENWMAPIRRWYNSDVSTVDYASDNPAKADVILEVGVLNYEYAFDRLILQVWVKLIDPRARQVLGRARSFEQSPAEPLAPLLQNDAEGMKRLVLETGNRLVTQCLAEVGLVSE